MVVNSTSNDSVNVVDYVVFRAEYKTAVSCICGLLLTVNIFAIYIMQQTSRIPPLNKFLASALLLFHVLSNSFIIIENITASVNVYSSTDCLIFVVIFTIMNAPTVALMSIERLWALSSMRLYFKYHESKIIKLIPIFVWSMYGLSVIVYRTRVCPYTFKPMMVCKHVHLYFKIVLLNQ